MRRLLEKAFLGACRWVPKRLASHLMFLLRTDRRLPDGWGVHIRPIHFYEPLPDFSRITLDQMKIRRWFPAIEWNIDVQLSLQEAIASPVGAELDALASESEGFPFSNEYFSHLDAAVYYALIRHLKPATIIEIGCGFSTRIADKALKRNRIEGHPGKLVCVEPYPMPRLTEANLEMELITTAVENLPLERFELLKENDILFIDSSHVAHFRSDVCREFLDILPRLKDNVWVHVHDIFLPEDYPAEWLVDLRIAFNEQYLLEAFLSSNRDFEIMSALHALWLDHAETLRVIWPAKVLPPVGDYGATSFWMRRKIAR